MYKRQVLDYVKRTAPSILTKTGFMLGLGESDEEIGELLDDLAKVKVDIVTIGQYLQPTKRHAELKRYVTPDEFETYRQIALAKGIGFVVSTPVSYTHLDVYKRQGHARSRFDDRYHLLRRSVARSLGGQKRSAGTPRLPRVSLYGPRVSI